MLRDTVVASAILAVAVATIAGVFGYFTIGLGVAAGLVVGSANGFAISALLGNGAPFVAASVMRLASFTALALLVAVAFGISAWAVVLGVGLAQLVMVAAGVRQGMRA